jgi:hypothetical protein
MVFLLPLSEYGGASQSRGIGVHDCMPEAFFAEKLTRVVGRSKEDTMSTRSQSYDPPEENDDSAAANVYVAPELARGKEEVHVDRTRPDQYACGALAYLVFSGGQELPTSVRTLAMERLQMGWWKEMEDALDSEEKIFTRVKNALGRDLVLRLLGNQPKDYRCF